MAMQRLCMALDIYYNDDVFTSCDDGTSKLIGNYIKQMNMNQYRNKTFDETLSEGFYFNGRGELEKSVSDDGDSARQNVDPRLIDKWGDGLDPEDYDVLERHYASLVAANPRSNSNQEIYIMDLCYTKMQQLKAIRDGNVDNYNKLTESYRKSFKEAGLKTVQDSDANNDDCWGTWMARISQYTPEEYYKNKKLYKDADNLGDYLSRFVLRPLRNLMYGTTERDAVYCVKDEDGDDYDEFSDETL